MNNLETVAEVMMNCWGVTYSAALDEVIRYYADGAYYDTLEAEWVWPDA